MRFKTLQEASRIRQKEWDSGQQTTLLYRAVELGGECGELLNVIKKLERANLGMVGSRATKQDLVDEMADVMICLQLVADKADIDLDQAVRVKFNKTSRKYGLTTLMEDENEDQNAQAESQCENASESKFGRFWRRFVYLLSPSGG